MKRYWELLLEYSGEKNRITYPELLQTEEWAEKRKEVLDRDGEKCTNCGVKNLKTRRFYRLTTKEEREKEQAELKESISFYVKLLSLSAETYQALGIIFNEDPVEHLNLHSKLYKLGFKKISLHVHHKFYIKSKLPWEYDDDALTTLCEICHFNLHMRESIPVFLDESLTITEQVFPCKKCNGIGVINKYLHFQNGICFQCGGRGFC